jgi:RND family efflux transporter MFP subunit
MAAEELGAVAGIVCQLADETRLVPLHVYRPSGPRGADALVQDLMSQARAAFASRRLKRTAVTSPAGHELVAAPVVYPDGALGVIALCVPSSTESFDHIAAVILYAAAWMGLASAIKKGADLTNDRDPTQANSIPLHQICLQAAAAPDLQVALAVLVNQVQSWLGCEIFCLTIAHGARDARVAAISKVASVDRRTELAVTIEAAARETMVLDRVQIFPGPEANSAQGGLAELCRQIGLPRAWSWPCKDGAGNVVSVCLALFSEHLSNDDSRLMALTESAPLIGSTVRLLKHGHEGLGRRIMRAALDAFGTLRRRRNLTVALAVVGMLMFAPWPYRLPCECVVEPVTRRFVSAPFDGILDRTLVRPGDRVSAGDELARMDGRELNMQLAGKQALVEQSRQRYTAALAKRDAAAAQLALMEMQQAEQEVGLLDERKRNLAIKSPLTGIVVSGDLHRVEGAPLTVGQKLFEVAPLDRMVVEISIPEHEVGAVREGQPVELSLDSYPGVMLRGTVTRLHPQAEIHDQKNVFVAEVELDAAEVALLPGMSGQAQISVGGRAAGWILFHRPWHYLRSKIVW